ncbi:signal peptide-containing protein [Theileria equi strain WA]|uniref:Signal peptide-containing protein n=1 Tax=Theileria equi strain WA TaxID=1537102 RepID=L0B0D3_THEEQ|nr:signal peptide-containing protein [Theileria equi strain WA]AFZ80943.1 signal peptide-containing protein [Theileria equi strain WA]|eukprot:XP_004830609.1 signal peptide-containing protein [Theileria equi strain WA]
MRIIAILWTVYLVGVCNCGDDTNVTKDVLKGTEDNVTNPGQSDQHTSLASKVDTSLFDVESSVEGNVPVLKLTAKEGTSTNRLLYDGQTVWEDDNKLCLSAILYMDEGKPTMTAIKAKGVKGGANFTLYRYHDGKKWKDEREFQHKNKLAELRKKYKHATPSTLDLSNPDTSKLDVHTETESGVSFKGYTPKNGYHISSVLYGESSVWKVEAGQKCKLVESYAKYEITILRLEISESSETKSKYFEKTDGEWNELKKDQFYEKAKALIGESGKNASLNISTPNSSQCQSFDYYYDDNHIKLMVPKKNVSVSKLMNSLENVCILSAGETFDHVKVYLNKDGQPELVLVASNFSSDIKYNYFAKNGTKWECTLKYTEKLKALKIVPAKKTDISIDLNKAEDTNGCIVFNVEPLYVQTRFHLPKPDYHANEVKDGSKKIWKPSGDERCTSCVVYSNNNAHLLSLFIKDGENHDHKYFEKNGSNWKEISKDEFDKKYDEMKDTAVRSS